MPCHSPPPTIDAPCPQHAFACPSGSTHYETPPCDSQVRTRRRRPTSDPIRASVVASGNEIMSNPGQSEVIPHRMHALKRTRAAAPTQAPALAGTRGFSSRMTDRTPPTTAATRRANHKRRAVGYRNRARGGATRTRWLADKKNSERPAERRRWPGKPTSAIRNRRYAHPLQLRRRPYTGSRSRPPCRVDAYQLVAIARTKQVPDGRSRPARRASWE
jgi:hypothetical protein